MKEIKKKHDAKRPMVGDLHKNQESPVFCWSRKNLKGRISYILEGYESNPLMMNRTSRRGYRLKDREQSL